MAQPARRRPSFEELYRQIEKLPEGVTGLILQPGVVSTMSRPGIGHQHALKQILRALERYDAGAGGRGWWILPECEARLPDERLVVPDVSGWRVDRVPKLPNENPLTVVPDWACEILSPSTHGDDRLLKLPLYARSGVRWVWMVDPDLRTVEVYESVGERPCLVAGARDADVVALAPFEEAMPLASWWLQAEASP